MATELQTEERTFRVAIGEWAKDYAARRVVARSINLDVEPAQADLRRWSGRYFNAQAQAAAPAAIVSAGRHPEARL
jgi:hypothetical protein